MTAHPQNAKTPETTYDIHPVLAQRWSPRGFDSHREVTEEELGAVLEAARWTPSAMNSQPWRFIVARRGTADFKLVAAALADFNQVWAPTAGVLIVACARTHTDDGAPMPWAVYDTGQAAAHLTVQAELLDLSVHQMGGFNPLVIKADFELPEYVVPQAVIALGHFDPDADLPDILAEREAAPRTREPLQELIVNGWPLDG